MCSNQTRLVDAADHLLEAIDPPSPHAVSIATFFRAGRDLAIRVSVLPEYRYLISRIPASVDGFDVLSEVASAPRAH